MQIAKLIDDGKDILQDGKEILEEGKEVVNERKELIEDLFEKGEEYLKTNLQLVKLKATDTAAEVASSVVTYLAVIIFAFFFLLMINIGIAFWIGSAMGKTHSGFLIVGGFYALIAGIVFILRDNLIKIPISNSIIEQMLKEKNHGQSKSN